MTDTLSPFERRARTGKSPTEEEALEMARELAQCSRGPLLRFRKCARWRFNHSYWATLLPDGPQLALETLRMLERRGYVRKMRSGPHQPDHETYMLTGKGLER